MNYNENECSGCTIKFLEEAVITVIEKSDGKGVSVFFASILLCYIDTLLYVHSRLDTSMIYRLLVFFSGCCRVGLHTVSDLKKTAF